LPKNTLLQIVFPHYFTAVSCSFDVVFPHLLL